MVMLVKSAIAVKSPENKFPMIVGAIILRFGIFQVYLNSYFFYFFSPKERNKFDHLSQAWFGVGHCRWGTQQNKKQLENSHRLMKQFMMLEGTS